MLSNHLNLTAPVTINRDKVIMDNCQLTLNSKLYNIERNNDQKHEILIE